MNDVIAELKARLEALKIAVEEDADGRWTAVSNSEPAFCFVRNSEVELAQLVADTLNSYARAFFSVEINAEVQTFEVRESIPVRHFRPNRKFSPTLFAAA